MITSQSWQFFNNSVPTSYHVSTVSTQLDQLIFVGRPAAIGVSSFQNIIRHSVVQESHGQAKVSIALNGLVLLLFYCGPDEGEISRSKRSKCDKLFGF